MARSQVLVALAVVGFFLAACSPSPTTAERLASLFNAGNNYPVCNPAGCIESITAKGNTVIAEYSVPKSSREIPPEKLRDRAGTAAKLKVEALKDICGALQDDFPDMQMQWAGHYSTSDGIPLASILITVGECPKFHGR